MKQFCLSNEEDTLIGMRLAGVLGKVVTTAEELEENVEKLSATGEYAIIMVTEPLADMAREFIQDKKMYQSVPLIVEIPSSKGSKRGDDFIMDYVKEAIGIKI